jgi:outer membrane protease
MGMIMKNLMRRSAGLAVFALSVTGASAQDNFLFGNDAISLSGGIGVLAVESNEYVYAGAGSSNVLSKLIWQSVSPMLTTGLDVKLPEGWTLDGEAQIALLGDSYMEDFDWRGGSFAEEDWTDRSQHDDTNLDWYFNGSMRVGHDFQMDEGTKVNLNAGFKYIDVQWSGFGGSYIYSEHAFRDTSGSAPADQAVITYRQQLPALFLGVDTEFVQDAWAFDFGAKAGVAFNSSDLDNHWLRGLVYVDDIDMSPMVALSARAEYSVADNMNVFVGGTVDKVFRGRGDTSITGAGVAFFPDAAGLDLMAASLSAGVKGTF